jgi:gliding motility-associated protein GldL
MGKLIDFESLEGKRRMQYFYSFGAAIVIVGALFKILHLPGGDIVIGTGLGAEAVIFVVSAFEPIHMESPYKWENVYPELLDANIKAAARSKQLDTNTSEFDFNAKINEMFAKANFDLGKIEKLGQGIEHFAKATDGLNEVVAVNESAKSYSEQLALASNHMSTINDFYSAQISQSEVQGEISQALINAAKSSAEYGNELSKATESIQKVNSLYNQQVSNMNDQVNISDEMVKNLSLSVEDAKKMNIQVQELTSNLANLNNIYGGMLSAMNFNKQ